VDDRPLQPLDGRRKAPDRKRMLIRSPEGASVSGAWFSPQRSGGEVQAPPLSAAFPPERSGGGNEEFSRRAV